MAAAPAVSLLPNAGVDALQRAADPGPLLTAGSRALDEQLQQQEGAASARKAAAAQDEPSPASSAPKFGSRPACEPQEDAPGAAQLRSSWMYSATGSLAAAATLAQLAPARIPSGGVAGVKAFAAHMITQHNLDDTFYVVDLANVVRLYKAWRAAMPRVVPFYAIKCNPDPGMLRLLAALGTGFDCASQGELEAVLGLGVPPGRIVFAHPCKRACDLRYARARGCAHTTFDTDSELHKLAALYPGARCVLRIRADDPEARVPLGLKYGADPAEAGVLLRTAQQLGLAVVGVSFHVGSACKNLAAYSSAIEVARQIFDLGARMGFGMELLDIGGGFSGLFDELGNVIFGEIASTINNALAAWFPPEMDVAVIAEPGRYFAEAAATLATPVVGLRDRPAPDGLTVKKEYWITDGLYGSFNCILYDGQNPSYNILRSPLLPPIAQPAPLFTSTLWGPTCDSADVVYKDVTLPLLRNGDWLLFPRAGAYTVAGACDFNGIEFSSPRKFYVFSEHAVDSAGAGGGDDGGSDQGAAAGGGGAEQA